jgi:hypothetical protein
MKEECEIRNPKSETRRKSEVRNSKREIGGKSEDWYAKAAVMGRPGRAERDSYAFP